MALKNNREVVPFLSLVMLLVSVNTTDVTTDGSMDVTTDGSMDVTTNGTDVTTAGVASTTANLTTEEFCKDVMKWAGMEYSRIMASLTNESFTKKELCESNVDDAIAKAVPAFEKGYPKLCKEWMQPVICNKSVWIVTQGLMKYCSQAYLQKMEPFVKIFNDYCCEVYHCCHAPQTCEVRLTLPLNVDDDTDGSNNIYNSFNGLFICLCIVLVSFLK